MKQRQKPGFTIIEVVLFLAISGLMAVGLMAGTGVALQRQQYRDSVQSYADFLRTQYSGVVSVQNDGQLSCPLVPESEAESPRGQSDCMVIGRYIMTNDGSDGGKYAVHPVFALQSADDGPYSYGFSDAADTNYELAWDTKTRLPAGPVGGILMYRHPETGVLAVKAEHGSPKTTENINELIESNESAASEVCVYGDGWLAGERLSVFVGANAGSADAITIGSASEGCQQDA